MLFLLTVRLCVRVLLHLAAVFSAVAFAFALLLAFLSAFRAVPRSLSPVARALALVPCFRAGASASLDLARVMQSLLQEREVLKRMVQATTPLDGLDDLDALRVYYANLVKGQDVRTGASDTRVLGRGTAAATPHGAVGLRQTHRGANCVILRHIVGALTRRGQGHGWPHKCARTNMGSVRKFERASSAQRSGNDRRRRSWRGCHSTVPGHGMYGSHGVVWYAREEASGGPNGAQIAKHEIARLQSVNAGAWARRQGNGAAVTLTHIRSNACPRCGTLHRTRCQSCSNPVARGGERCGA